MFPVQHPGGMGRCAVYPDEDSIAVVMPAGNETKNGFSISECRLCLSPVF
jgi:hypothetical protein